MATMSSALKSNKKILSKNLYILEDNIQLLSGKFGDRSDDLITEVYLIGCNLNRVKTDRGFAKVFFDFFIVMQEFHFFVVDNNLSDLVKQNYSGYLNLDRMW